MRKGKEILGLPVITLDRAAKVGVVRDLVIDPASKRVTGFLVGPAGRVSTKYISFDSLRRIGPDCLLIDSEGSVSSAQGHSEPMTLMEGSPKLSGLQLFTDAGRSAGKVSDITLDERTGAIYQYEVSSGRMQDLLSGKRQISSSIPLAVGGDAMLVPESALMAQGSEREIAQAVAVETPPRKITGEFMRQIEQIAADTMMRQEDLIMGRRAGRTMANEDAGGLIVFEGETITPDVVQKAKEAGKLNQLVASSGEAASAAMSGGLEESYTDVAIGRMAGRTIHTPEGQVLVAQGDVVTKDVVSKARQAGVLDQLIEAVKPSAEEMAAKEPSMQRAARSVWDQIGGTAARPGGEQ